MLRSWVRIPPGAWMSVCCECCVLSGRDLCDELITRPEESYRPWYVVVCDLEKQNSWMRRPRPTRGLSRQEKKNEQWYASESAKSEIRRKACGLLSSGACLQHDNDRPPTARHTVKKIQNVKLQVLPHPQYSPNLLLPSNFHLLWLLEDALGGCNFRSDEKVKEAVRDWLAQQPKDFSRGIYA
jgi:hypothetical protein